MPEQLLFTRRPSPIGELLLLSDGDHLTAVYMSPHKGAPARTPAWREDAGPFRRTIEQLDAYFAGELRTFDLPLAPTGTPFQRAVWNELARIPYGETISYATLASRVGHPGASRAVGAANGRNPISIVVPCHRVIGADGRLTGYGGGVERKAWLLSHEHGASGDVRRARAGAELLTFPS